MKIWSEIKEYKGRNRIHIDGSPYLTLGIQYDYLNCTKIEDFDYLFQHTVSMGCNTLFFPLRWLVLEPEEGKYNWEVLDHAIERCREFGLRMSLLWFGTNQGGSSRPAPEWVTGDRKRFPRIIDERGRERDGLCPNNRNTLEAERKTFNKLLSHLAEVDGSELTVIMMQIENEVCLYMSHERPEDGLQPLMDFWSPRCYCSLCNESYEKEGESEFEFGVRSLINYLNSLLRDQKSIFPVLTYVNFPINPLRPGEDVEMYLEECHGVDFIAPDYYGFTPGDLAFAMQHFTRGRNIPFIAEHSTESVGDADLNLYLAVCEHGTQGFSPWAMDHTFGWRAWRDGVKEKPFVDRNGDWSDAAISYGRALSAMNHASRQIAALAGTEDMIHYISYGTPRKIEERRWGMRWRLITGKDGKCIILRTGEYDYTVLGVDTLVTVCPVVSGKSLLVEEGRWHKGEWMCKSRILPAGETEGETRNAVDTLEMDLGYGTAFRIRLE